MSIFQFKPDQYGPAWTELLATDRCRPLGKLKPDAALRSKLASVQLAELFAPRKIINEQMAELCLAGAWLLADDLDASHNISQQIETPSGSFWHGIMHRREADFENAKYWFRRVGQHPVYAALGEAAKQLATVAESSDAREKLLAADRWDPYLFVDLCAAGARQGAAQNTGVPLCQHVAHAEWELLFDDCYQQAVQ